MSLAEADVEGKYVMLKNNSEEVTFHLRIGFVLAIFVNDSRLGIKNKTGNE